MQPRQRKILIASLATLLGAAAAGAQLWRSSADENDAEGAGPAGTGAGTGTGAPAADRFPVIINEPPGPPRVDTGLVDARGQPVTASCTTCHATRAPNPANRSSADLDEFHQGLVFAHGTLSCLSCHDAGDYDRLRLADGTSIDYGGAGIMTLCGQCHSRQLRDYTHGAHGGMNGYWDLSRGPRYRNHCVDCHDPHSPAFPRMLPTFKPRDRFLEPSPPGGEHHDE